MTLKSCRTITGARQISGSSDVLHFQGQTFHSVDYPDHRVFVHLNLLRQELQLPARLEVFSRNLFPTACGIASSASGFAALTLAVTAALTSEYDLHHLSLRGINRGRLAHFSRRGSGSAGRSLYGGFVHWKASSSPLEQDICQIADDSHWDLSDVIVVLSKDQKHTASSEAHKAAWSSPLFAPRLAGMPPRIETVLSAIEAKDLERLGECMETEALDMHAVAMTSNPTINYFREETPGFLAWMRQERLKGNLPGWFTMDAGPNIHVICLTTDVSAVVAAIKARWPNYNVIIDKVGPGPTLDCAPFDDTAKEVSYV